MHRIHSIDVSETDDGKHAVVIMLGGVLDESMEPILRYELDKTLIRQREGGVILDLYAVTELASAVVARIVYSARHLSRDSIRMVIVAPKKPVSDKNPFGDGRHYYSVVPSLKIAKEVLDINE